MRKVLSVIPSVTRKSNGCKGMAQTRFWRRDSNPPKLCFTGAHIHGARATECRKSSEHNFNELYNVLLPEARDWTGADLEAARAACSNRLDFARLLPQVEKCLA